MKNHRKVIHLETEIAQNSHKMRQSALGFYAQALDWKPGVKGKSLKLQGIVAEREGFEPPLPVKVNLISSQAPSTGLGHLSAYSLLNIRANRYPPALPKTTEKPFQDLSTLLLQDTARYCHTVIQPGIITEMVERLHCPTL